MSPVLSDGQLILIQKQYRSLQHGDVVVFRNPLDGHLMVKRCVLLSEEPVLINGMWLETSRGNYYLSRTQAANLSQWTRVPPDSYILIGDNSFHSCDSRDFGPVSESSILGKVVNLHE